ncbi:large subunit ribosomal protein L15 [Entomortierella parvispora]|uniref:Large subunit ribosomal protein L15 n=1 Tax=Entomortierella parvispora TaxID=205924 RepID=A0A9P3H2S8_9FUNG|nr:large subunit ribosomal protein L15 [Entomortierella parvispora]
MLRLTVLKPARLATTNITRCINYESRAFLSTKNSNQDAQKIAQVYERLGFGLSDSNLMTQAVTHKSFAHGSLPTNEKLSYLGRQFLEMHVAEKNWDRVKSNKTLKANISHSLGSEKLAKVAKSMGINEVMRWKPNSSAASGEATVLAQTMEAIVGAVYHDKGSKAAREFVTKHIYTY